MSNAGQRHLNAIANHRIIIYAQNGDLIGDLNFGFNARVDDVRRNAVVVTENAERIAQRTDRVDDPSPTQCPVDVAAEAGAPVPVELAIVLGVGIGTLAGFVNGLIVVYGALPSLVVTIGTLALYRGIAQIILEERGVSGLPDWYQNIGFGTIGGTPIPWSSIIFVLLFIGFAVFLHATHWGRALYAIGNNLGAARFSGINVKRAILGVFIASGAMSSVAAIVLTAYLASARSDTAVGLELLVITAVVLGGVNIFGGAGTMAGVLIALLVLAFVQNALGLAGVTPEEQQIVPGAVLIVTLIVFGASAIIKKTRETLWRYLASRSSRE